MQLLLNNPTSFLSIIGGLIQLLLWGVFLVAWGKLLVDKNQDGSSIFISILLPIAGGILTTIGALTQIIPLLLAGGFLMFVGYIYMLYLFLDVIDSLDLLVPILLALLGIPVLIGIVAYFLPSLVKPIGIPLMLIAFLYLLVTYISTLYKLAQLYGKDVGWTILLFLFQPISFCIFVFCFSPNRKNIRDGRIEPNRHQTIHSKGKPLVGSGSKDIMSKF